MRLMSERLPLQQTEASVPIVLAHPVLDVVVALGVRRIRQAAAAKAAAEGAPVQQDVVSQRVLPGGVFEQQRPAGAGGLVDGVVEDAQPARTGGSVVLKT